MLATTAGSMSRPITWYPRPASIAATGRPMYPRPTTHTLVIDKLLFEYAGDLPCRGSIAVGKRWLHRLDLSEDDSFHLTEDQLRTGTNQADVACRHGLWPLGNFPSDEDALSQR